MITEAELTELIEREAERLVNRNMYELHEADARVRKFKDGANLLKPALLEAIEALEFYGNLGHVKRQTVNQLEFDAVTEYGDKAREALNKITKGTI